MSLGARIHERRLAGTVARFLATRLRPCCPAPTPTVNGDPLRLHRGLSPFSADIVESIVGSKSRSFAGPRGYQPREGGRVPTSDDYRRRRKRHDSPPNAAVPEAPAPGLRRL